MFVNHKSTKIGTLQNQVNFSKNDSKVCTACTKSFSIITRKHCCSKCDKKFCSKCSKVSVTTKNNSFIRERVCAKCSLALEQLKAKLPLGSPFTPSKLHILNESAGENGQNLWSADSESDSDNDDDKTSINSIKENLSLQISQENVQDEHEQKGIKAFTSNTTVNNKKPFTISFKDDRSGISSILSPISIETSGTKVKTNISLVKCSSCNEQFTNNIKKHICCQCKRCICGTCSDSNLTTHNNSLVRQRLCKFCASTTANSLLSPITSKKLRNLNPVSNNQIQEVWSADTVTDCNSEVSYSDENNQLKERLYFTTKDEDVTFNTDKPLITTRFVPTSIITLLFIITIIVLHAWFPSSILYKYDKHPVLYSHTMHCNKVESHYKFWKDAFDYKFSKEIDLVDLHKVHKKQVNINHMNYIQEFFYKIKKVIDKIKFTLERFLRKNTFYNQEK